VTHIEHLERKYQTIASTETRYEDHHLEDAELVLVAFGYMGRCCKEAVLMARAEGIRAGLLRPITLWPFPSEAIRKLADRNCQFLVAEDNMGQMVQDVRLAVEGRATVHLLNASARDVPTGAGVIFPHRVFQEIQKLA
jgi:2-oxoglutarate ferredoxin oxidoreductase subunit alpha